MLDWNTREAFEAAYRSTPPEGRAPGDPVRFLHYQRRTLYPAIADRWRRIAERLAWPPQTRILIVGCGFGWGIEALQELGYASVWGIDTSTWIQSSKDETDAEDGQLRSKVGARVRADDLSKAGDRNRLIRETVATGGFDVIATEQVLSTLTDQQATALHGFILDSGVLATGGTLLHIIQPRLPQHPASDPDWNWHTVEEWEAMLPGAVWADGMGRVL